MALKAGFKPKVLEYRGGGYVPAQWYLKLLWFVTEHYAYAFFHSRHGEWHIGLGPTEDAAVWACTYTPWKEGACGEYDFEDRGEVIRHLGQFFDFTEGVAA